MAYNNSDALHQYMKNHGCNFEKTIDVTLADGTSITIDNTQIWSNGFSIDDAISSDTSFDIGGVVINKLSLTLNNLYDDFDDIDLFGAELKPTLRLKDENGVLLWQARKGTFTADVPVLNGSLISVTAYDDMRKFDKVYDTDLSYPASVTSIIRDACSKCGVLTDLDDSKFDQIVIYKRPDAETTTYREILSWCCQILGAYARIRMNGTPILQIKRITDNKPDSLDDDNIALNEYFSLTSDVDDAVVTGIKVVIKSNADGNTLMTFKNEGYRDGYVFSLEGNELIDESNAQQIADSIALRYVGFTFRVCEISSLSDPAIEAGDWMTAVDRKGNKITFPVTSTSFRSGNMQKIVCSGEKTSRKSSQRFSQSIKNYAETKKMFQREKTQRELMQKDLEDKINSNGGMFTTTERDESGNIVAYYLHNAENLDESLTIWKMTSDAMAVSTDGGKTWNGGITVDGNIIANILNANGVDASWIRSGEINIKDDKGNQTFYANTATGEVKINAKSIEIGGQTIQQLAQDAATQAGGLAVTLSNEFQLVPSNSDGVADLSSDVSCEVNVYYNGQDVTDASTITAVPSSNLTISPSNGTLDSNHSIHVTSIDDDTDDGFVDFNISYLTMTTRKRFRITKLKDAKGSYNYSVECNTGILKISSDGVAEPKKLNFYVSVNDGEKDILQGVRFRIEESKDHGSTFDTVYETPSDSLEFTVEHYLATFITNNNGDVITDSNGYALGFYRNITDVRCKAIVGNIVVAQKTITSYTESKEYTHEEIFKLLTNDGVMRGIYKIDNNLYINADYIRSGTLKLGGSGNGNGKLEIYASDGKTLIGKWDKDGVAIKQGSFETENSTYKTLIDNGVISTYYGNSSSKTKYGELKASGYSSSMSNYRGYELNGTDEVNYVGISHNGSKKLFYAKTGVNKVFAENSIAVNCPIDMNVNELYWNRWQTSDNRPSTTTIKPVYFKYGDKTKIDELDDAFFEEDGSWAEDEVIKSNALSLKGAVLNADGGLTANWLETYGGFGLGRVYNPDWDSGIFYSEVSFGNEIWSEWPFHVEGALYVRGSKNRVVDTENYGNVCFGAYETGTPYFGDLGSGITDENGICVVSIDDTFYESTNTESEYYVFLQKEGKGDIWVSEKHSTYFIVEGTENLKFSWEIKAVQRGYDDHRMVIKSEYGKNKKFKYIDYESEYNDIISNENFEMESIENSYIADVDENADEMLEYEFNEKWG